MTLDCRIDRRELRDPFDLPTLTRERLSWSLPPDQQWPVLEPIRRLTRGQWALLVLETLQGQVDNGGFFGLFDNAGEYFLDAMDAARVVGARPFIPLLDEVREKLPDGIPLDDHDERERLEPLVSGLDDRFYEARKVEGLDLFDFALRFAGAHPEEFFLTEPEADADLTDFIDRLRARIGNQPTATQEQAAGLPPTARAVYTRVGRPEGDWGPWAEGDYFVDPAEPAGPVYLRDEDGVERWVAASLRGWLENWLRVAS